MEGRWNRNVHESRQIQIGFRADWMCLVLSIQKWISREMISKSVPVSKIQIVALILAISPFVESIKSVKETIRFVALVSVYAKQPIARVQKNIHSVVYFMVRFTVTVTATRSARTQMTHTSIMCGREEEVHFRRMARSKCSRWEGIYAEDTADCCHQTVSTHPKRCT